jgi:hypothetical protein
VSAKQQFFHLDRRLLGVPPRPVSVLFGWKVGFKDRFQHQRCRRHADPIPQGRDAQGPELAIGLRYVHSPDWVRSVGLVPERKRQFAQPALQSVRLDLGEILSVYPRRAFIRAALGIGMRQDVVTADLVVQSIKPVAGFRLRFRV